MAVALAAFFVSIVLIFVVPPVGIIALPLTFIWVIIAFCVSILGWGFRGGKRKSDD
ncbi:MAG: hypothetical protein HOJ90_10875 [Alphaproteobacteria bacterium]|jgi:hypothetical protein|nr:hypothetical protein [Alphaproteobacteria bacterium]